MAWGACMAGGVCGRRRGWRGEGGCGKKKAIAAGGTYPTGMHSSFICGVKAFQFFLQDGTFRL